MGGRCYVLKAKKDGSLGQFLGPECTDNFQVIASRFSYQNLDWYSVEQAFQSLKFPMGSVVQVEIHQRYPLDDESDDDYGGEVWLMGQRRDIKLRDDWEREKVKLMLLLNLAKYNSDKSMQEDLIETGDCRIVARSSTGNWKHWNECIQTLIRDFLISKQDISKLISEIEKIDAKLVKKMLMETKRNVRTSITDPIRIDTIEIGKVRLGLSLCPGKVQSGAISGDWNRDLAADLDKISKEGYDAVVSLIEDLEIDELSVQGLKEDYVQSRGMEWIWAPIRDGGTPSDSTFQKLERVLEILNDEKSVFIHCKGGLGRAGLVAAWILTHHGRTPEDAISEIRNTRRGAIENMDQEHWVKFNSGKHYYD